MTLIESEAKKKWCPFSTLHIVRNSRYRLLGFFSPRRVDFGWSRCIGQDCIRWQVVDSLSCTGFCTVRAVDPLLESRFDNLEENIIRLTRESYDHRKGLFSLFSELKRFVSLHSHLFISGTCRGFREKLDAIEQQVSGLEVKK